MMKKAFTLIEILVVLLIMSLIIGIIAPKGAKMFDSVTGKIDLLKKSDKIKDEKFKSFLNEEGNKTLGINRYGVKYR